MCKERSRRMRILTERPHLRNPSINIMMKATVGASFNLSRFEETIRKLRQVHPLITSNIKTDKIGNAYYQCGEVKKNDFTIVEKSTWLNVAEREKDHYFNLDTDPLVRYFVFQKQDDFDLLIVAHHLLGDGLAIFNLLKDFSLIYFGAEVPVHNQRLIQGINDFPKSAKSSMMMDLLIKKWNRDWRKHPDIYSQSEFRLLHSEFVQEHKSALLTSDISRGKLFILIKNCHKYRVSVNDALTTALILAQQKHHPKLANEQQEIAIPINIRGELKFNPVDSLGNFASAITIKAKLDDTRSFWENAKIIRKDIQRKTSSDKKRWVLMNLYARMDPNLIDSLYFTAYGNDANKTSFKVAKMLGLTGNPQVTGLSNLGRVNDFTENKYLYDCFFFPPKVPNAAFTIGVITLQNSLTLGVTFDEQAVGYLSAKQIVETMVNYLISE
ncbi:condensation domain-containing protein [Lentilactobacillus otakiensis]|uniref:Condensation domain-containing protein n=1 Tax=Lentilactobacillus otakiensis DSM 19908 = JCM 15040 TaxID=1423780 RepID=S4NBZ7_9LACO|nr:condensation domain-containing protein [Lentilactobacillus otakiensis]MBZ3776972.1 hypothetical protein [Lentilactobacillus otakiensis]GAD16274.1 hypothetical protein LOT_0812 [Lentilactobacillus otakiensis DSM 19908 = JCM 15040]